MNRMAQETVAPMIRTCLEQFPGVEAIEERVLCTSGKCIVRLIVDHAEGGITLEQCAEVNRTLAAALSAAYPEEDFTVEVDSPGLDRMLSTEKDFLRSRNETIGVWLKGPLHGKTYIEGVCRDVRDGRLVIAQKQDLVTIPLSLINTGKRIVTWRYS